MVKLLVYAYCTGKPSSRKIERATYEEVPYRVLAANQHPDHDSIAAFRQQHLPALAGLFTQVLALCRQAGLVKLGHVALDGTKVLANASKHKAMSYGRMGEAERKLEAEVADPPRAGRSRSMRRRTRSTGRAGAGTSCRPSWPAARAGWPRSARPRPPWRRRPGRRPPRRRPPRRPSWPSGSGRPRPRAGSPRAAPRRSRTRRRPHRSPRRSGTSPIPSRGS